VGPKVARFLDRFAPAVLGFLSPHRCHLFAVDEHDRGVTRGDRQVAVRGHVEVEKLGRIDQVDLIDVV
jgi:hypothetical protein